MTPARFPLLSLLPVLLVFGFALVAIPSPLRAEDADEGPPLARARIDLGAYLASPAPEGPRMILPSDVEPTGAWPIARELEQWFKFSKPTNDAYVVPPEVLIESLHDLFSPHFDKEELSAEFTDGQGIRLAGRPEVVRRAADVMRWTLEGMAPFQDVTAVLTSEGEEPRLRAAGRVRLWGGNWIQVFFQHGDTGIAASWDLEIAQESTAMHPEVVQMPEGEELYLRFLPGESVNVIEVWVGHLRHLEMRDIDLSVIRNVPESSAPGKLTLPQTAGYRAYAAFSVPADRASTKTIRWAGPAGPVRLTLSFDAATLPHSLRKEAREDIETYGQVLRIGAIGAPLEFDLRHGTSERFVDSLRMADEENSYDALGWSLLRYFGEAVPAARARQRILDEEARLQTRQVRLRTLTVSESGLRQALLDRRLQVGGAVDGAVVQELAERGGTVVTGDLSLPMLENVDMSYRVGTSVTGLRGFEVDVAQQAGGMHVEVGARFAGLAGTLRLVPHGGGHRLAVSARLSWATPEGSTVDLVFRPPVGVKTETKSYEGVREEKVRLPILGGGEALVEAEAPLPADGQEVLLGLTTRGTEAILLLGSVGR